MADHTAHELYAKLAAVLNELEQVDGPVALLVDDVHDGGIRVAGQSGAVTYSPRHEEWIHRG